MKIKAYNSKIFILLVFIHALVCSSLIYAQEVNVHAEILVYEFQRKNDFIEGATVLLIVKDDTLAKLKTNNEGYCIWDGKANKNDSIQFKVSKQFYESQHYFSPTLLSNMDLKLEFDLNPYHPSGPMHPVFSDDTTLIFSNFEVDFFKFVFRKIPEYCLEFVYVSFDEANDKLASQRMNHFKNYLLSNGISENMFYVVEKSIISNLPHEEGLKARIEGRLVSMSKCGE